MATWPRSRKRCAPRSRPRPTASSPPAPIRAALSTSPRRPTPPTSRSSTSTRPTRRRASTPMSAATTSSFGRHWAQYLVDKGLVKKGDFVWMPVEVPGATYGVQEDRRHLERLQAARHHLGGDRSHARPGRGHQPHGRLPDRQPQEDQGDHRPRRSRRPAASSASSTRSASSRARSRSSAGATRSTPRRKCSTATSTPAQWQDPQATSYVALSLAAMAAERHPAGLQRHHRRALREGQGRDLRQDPVRQVSPPISRSRPR